MQGLVNTPEAVDFLTSTQLETGLKLAVGDAKVDAMVGPDIVAAQIALKDAGKKILALAQDPTRTDVQRHEAGRKIAREVEERLERTRVALERHAEQLRESALEKAEHVLGPKPSRSAIESELRGWVRDQGRRSNGIEHITRAMRENVELAGVVYTGPRFLLGLSVNMYDRLRVEALEIHAPEVHAKLSNAAGLERMVERCKVTVRRVHQSFYSAVMAAQASKRVQV